MAEGIVKRHSTGCRSKQGGRCNCNAGYEAWIYLPKEKRKIRKTFRREAEAKSWRATALVALTAGELRTPSQLTVEQAAWLWLEAADTGAVRDRSGGIATSPAPSANTGHRSGCACCLSSATSASQT